MSKLQEKPSAQKRTPSNVKHEISLLFFYFSGLFLPSWIQIWIPNPDPLTWLNPDPIRIRIQNTGYRHRTYAENELRVFLFLFPFRGLHCWLCDRTRHRSEAAWTEHSRYVPVPENYLYRLILKRKMNKRTRGSASAWIFLMAKIGWLRKGVAWRSWQSTCLLRHLSEFESRHLSKIQVVRHTDKKKCFTGYGNRATDP